MHRSRQATRIIYTSWSSHTQIEGDACTNDMHVIRMHGKPEREPRAHAYAHIDMNLSKTKWEAKALQADA